jgi:hypothetical protein
MLLGIDHLVIAVEDLDEAARGIEEALGLAATGGGRHPALGTENRLVFLGDSYLELVSIADPEVAERSWLGAPVMTTLAKGGGGFATWAVETDALDDDVAALRALGSSLGPSIAGERVRTDGAVVRWRVALPGLLGPGEPPFLIEHDPGSAEWAPADRAARREQAHPIGGPGGGVGPVRVEVLELATDAIPAAIGRLTRTVGLRFRPSLAGGGARDANIGRQIVRLRPTRGQALLPSIVLASPAGDDRVVELLGCRWTIRKSG